MTEKVELKERIAELLNERLFTGSVGVTDLAESTGVDRSVASKALESFPETPEGLAFQRDNDVHLSIVLQEGEVHLRPDIGGKNHTEFGLTSESTSY